MQLLLFCDLGLKTPIHAAKIVFVGGFDHSPSPILAHFCRGQTAGCMKMPLGIKADLGPGDFVFDGDQARHIKRAHPTHPTKFVAYVYCVHTAGWIKMPLGTEVNVGPGDVVLGRVAAPQATLCSMGTKLTRGWLCGTAV